MAQSFFFWDQYYQITAQFENPLDPKLLSIEIYPNRGYGFFDFRRIFPFAPSTSFLTWIPGRKYHHFAMGDIDTDLERREGHPGQESKSPSFSSHRLR